MIVKPEGVVYPERREALAGSVDRRGSPANVGGCDGGGAVISEKVKRNEEKRTGIYFSQRSLTTVRERRERRERELDLNTQSA